MESVSSTEELAWPSKQKNTPLSLNLLSDSVWQHSDCHSPSSISFPPGGRVEVTAHVQIKHRGFITYRPSVYNRHTVFMILQGWAEVAEMWRACTSFPLGWLSIVVITWIMDSTYATVECSTTSTASDAGYCEPLMVSRWCEVSRPLQLQQLKNASMAASVQLLS